MYGNCIHANKHTNKHQKIIVCEPERVPRVGFILLYVFGVISSKSALIIIIISSSSSSILFKTPPPLPRIDSYSTKINKKTERERGNHEHAACINSLSVSLSFAYGHTTLNTPDLVRSRKLSRVGPG